MAVNYEIKGQLARLLATEDLVVEHKKVSTACFNVHTRVLTLPLWERASNAIYDMLVAHEVGHALYTPDIDWTEQVNIPPSYVNIVEDARIEKLMKRRYAGLGKTFYSGYSDLNDQDFFELDDDDLSTYSFPDRVNLWFKIGNFINVPINQGKETEIINLIANSETFADVLIAAEEMYKFTKEAGDSQKENNLKVTLSPEANSEVEMSGDSLEQNSEEENNQAETESQTQSKSESGDQAFENMPQSRSELGGQHDSTEIKTDQRLKDAIEQLSSMDQPENVYIELPTLDLDAVIGKNDEIYTVLDNFWSDYKGSEFKFVDEEYKKFKMNAQKEVNYLVKEFECRKAADSYARASTARTGVLDCSKLHTYKYNEDLFKKVTTLADGKNHGLIFILDWSGSMDRVLLDTIKQLYNLIWFCKKIQIPFEVYAFSNEWKCVTYDENNRPVYPPKNIKKEVGKFFINDDFALMNFFSSKTKSVELEKQMMSIYRVGKYYSERYIKSFEIPGRLSLSGTPLNESIIALNQIIPQFQKQYKLQKVHTMILTDGESNTLNYGYEHSNLDYIGIRSFYPQTCMVRDRKNGHIYSADKMLDSHTAFTDMLLRYLRNQHPAVNFIGMRVLGSGEANSFIRRFVWHDRAIVEKLQQHWKKDKSFTIPTKGYHSYFGIAANSFSVDSEFVVSDNASKNEIIKAFKKSMSCKKFNKKILNEFIQLIA